ncbi:hypothetical protein RUND412_002886 [Rhizina undulata]
MEELGDPSEPEVLDGGCLCSMIRYRITVFKGERWLEVKHCYCTACRKTRSTLTRTAITVPTTSIQWFSRDRQTYQPSPPLHFRLQQNPPDIESSRKGKAREVPTNVDTFEQSISSSETSSSTSAVSAIIPQPPQRAVVKPLRDRVLRRAGNYGESSSVSGGVSEINPLPELKKLRDQGKGKEKSISTKDSPPGYETLEHTENFSRNILKTESLPGWPYKEYSSPPGTLRGFCEWCGGSISLRKGTPAILPDVIEIEAGSLDDPAKGIVGRFTRETWCQNKFPEEWDIGIGVPGDVECWEKEVGEVCG